MKMFSTCIVICCIALSSLVNAEKSVWKAVDISNTNKPLDIGRYAVLILNRRINLPQQYVINIWNQASYRATADGGTNRWYNFVSTVTPVSKLTKAHPDIVVGDLDSIKPTTLDYAKEHDVKIVRSPDQDNTDFTKALQEIVKETNGEIDSVVAFCENSGRLDHIMGNLNTMYNLTQVFGNRPIRLYLLSTESLSWILPTGSHEIHVPHSMVESQATCGLIPLGAPAVVTTTGLKWNLDNGKMEFGGLISTSNTYDKTTNDVVSVVTDSPLLWTMELVDEDE